MRGRSTLAMVLIVAVTACRDEPTGTSAVSGAVPKPGDSTSVPPPAAPPTPATPIDVAAAPAPSTGGSQNLSEKERAERDARRAGILGDAEPGRAKATIELPDALPTGFDRASVERLLPGLRYCYEKTLVAVPTLEGDVSIALTVARNGRVADAKLSGLDDPDLSPCVKDVVRNYRVRDSKSAGQATVSFTLQLRKLTP